MKIIKFTAENVKKLKLVEITPSGALVQISGKNGQGKSSVLDSIWWALAGKEAIQSVPVRKGADKGRIELDLGQYIVERKFTASGSTIQVRNREGAMFGSPQTMLDALIGDLSFDPLAFARMDARQQFDELRRIAKVSIDIEAINAENRRDFTTRTEVNRQAKAARARLSAIVIPEVRGDPVNEQAFLDRMEEASKHNSSIEAHKAKVAGFQRDAREATERARGMKQRAEALHAEADGLEQRAAAEFEKADDASGKAQAAGPAPEPIDTASIRADLEKAREINRAIQERNRKAEEHKRVMSEAESQEARSKELTASMEAREKSKIEALRESQMPVDGLGFGDGMVTYNGLPFDQASDAERLRVSIAIAMAANPKLRVIRVRDGSLLDEDSLKAIAEVAAEKDYQVWLERVDGTGKIGVVMEDGEVVADNQGASA